MLFSSVGKWVSASDSLKCANLNFVSKPRSEDQFFSQKLNNVHSLPSVTMTRTNCNYSLFWSHLRFKVYTRNLLIMYQHSETAYILSVKPRPTFHRWSRMTNELRNNCRRTSIRRQTCAGWLHAKLEIEEEHVADLRPPRPPGAIEVSTNSWWLRRQLPPNRGDQRRGLGDWVWTGHAWRAVPYRRTAHICDDTRDLDNNWHSIREPFKIWHSYHNDIWAQIELMTSGLRIKNLEISLCENNLRKSLLRPIHAWSIKYR